MSCTTADFHIFRPRNVHLLRRWRGGQQRTNWMVDCWGRILRGELSPLVSRWGDQRGRSIMKTWRPSPFPSLPPSFPKHPLHGWVLSQTILSSSTFQTDLVTPSMGHPSSLPWQVLVVACRRLAGNGVATWVGTRWIFTCCRKMPHRIHGDWLDADGDGLRKHLAMPWLHHSDPFWSILIYSAVLITWFQLQYSIDSILQDDHLIFPGWPPPPWPLALFALGLGTAQLDLRREFVVGCPGADLCLPLGSLGMGCLMVDSPEKPDAPIDMCHEHLTNAFAKCEGSCFLKTCLVGTKWTNDRLVANFFNQ